uniref:Interleukin-8-like n=1 Tax=Callorhinchus milii TaxID=7868 RepID=A0A4W3IU83_CALMI
MNSKVTITILAFLILYVTSTQGASLRGKGANLQCQCIKPSSDFIRPTRMKEIDIIPSGPHCGNVEIIMSPLQIQNKSVCTLKHPGYKESLTR